MRILGGEGGAITGKRDKNRPSLQIAKMISASAQCVMTRHTIRVNHSWRQRANKPKTRNVNSMSTTPCLTQHSNLAACISIKKEASS
jgi:hypothetical protein